MGHGRPWKYSLKSRRAIQLKFLKNPLRQFIFHNVMYIHAWRQIYIYFHFPGFPSTNPIVDVRIPWNDARSSENGTGWNPLWSRPKRSAWDHKNGTHFYEKAWFKQFLSLQRQVTILNVLREMQLIHFGNFSDLSEKPGVFQSGFRPCQELTMSGNC